MLSHGLADTHREDVAGDRVRDSLRDSRPAAGSLAAFTEDFRREEVVLGVFELLPEVLLKGRPILAERLGKEVLAVEAIVRSAQTEDLRSRQLNRPDLL